MYIYLYNFNNIVGKVPMHTMKTHSSNSGIAPNILNLCPGWRCADGQLHCPDTLQMGKIYSVPSE